VVILTVLLTPADAERGGDPRLTTHSSAPQGARGLFETLRRLGWRAERREVPFAGPLDAGVTYAVLDPPRPTDLSAGEAHRLLDAVRDGASLLFVATPGSTLADSLGIRASTAGGPLVAEPSAPCPPGADGGRGAINWPDGRVHSYWLTSATPLPFDTVTFASVRRAPTMGERGAGRARRDSVTSPAALGFGYGRGRVVAVADPDLLRNDVLRVCRWGAGVAAVRMLEWLAEGVEPRSGRSTATGEEPQPDGRGERRANGPGGAQYRIVFDEYHQGFGTHANPVRAVGRALTSTAPGRAVLQGIAAALVLLVALGTRPLAPAAARRIERRSPLEHVGALAHAYEQVGATRLATRRLVRGLRRRHAGAAWRRGDDEEFLRALAARHPEIAPSVARVADAAARPLTATEFVEVGAAVDHIERALRP
jgi:hypothetical protein